MKIIVQKSFIHEPDGDEKENEKSVRKSRNGHFYILIVNFYLKYLRKKL